MWVLGVWVMTSSRWFFDQGARARTAGGSNGQEVGEEGVWVQSRLRYYPCKPVVFGFGRTCTEHKLMQVNSSLHAPLKTPGQRAQVLCSRENVLRNLATLGAATAMQ